MPSNNPLQQRRHVESFRSFARHTFGQQNFGWYTVFYAMLFMLVAGWLPEGIADFFNYLFSDYSQWQMNYKLLVSLLILCWFAVQLNTITASQSIKVNPAAS